MLNMYEIIELENKYNEYKKRITRKRSFLFLSIGFFSCLFVLLFVIFINFFSKQNTTKENIVFKKENPIIQDELTKNIIKKEKEKILQSKITNIVAKQNAEKINENSIKQYKKIQEEYKKLSNNIKLKQEKLPRFEIKSIEVKNSTKKSKQDSSNLKPIIIKDIKTPKEVFVNANLEISQSNLDNKVDENNNSNIIIKESVVKNSQNKNIKSSDINELLNNYNDTRSIYFALELSKQYYLVKDYDNSRKWSIIANQIDKSNEESWILFAKASYKLGQKEQALNALTNYNKEINSIKINKLIEQIKGNSL